MPAGQHLIGHGRGCGVVAGRRVGVLVAGWAWRHLVVALGAGAGLVGALRRGGCIGGELVCVVPAETRNEGGTCWGSREEKEVVAVGRAWAGANQG